LEYCRVVHHAVECKVSDSRAQRVFDADRWPRPTDEPRRATFLAQNHHPLRSVEGISVFLTLLDAWRPDPLFEDQLPCAIRLTGTGVLKYDVLRIGPCRSSSKKYLPPAAAILLATISHSESGHSSAARVVAACSASTSDGDCPGDDFSEMIFSCIL
jgi:hypothetical protein